MMEGYDAMVDMILAFYGMQVKSSNRPSLYRELKFIKLSAGPLVVLIDDERC
jgi:hypothetical protein